MGLMDKVKQGAGTALNKAQQGVNQGKAKIDQAQSKHQWDGLLTKLGAAVYAERRQGGPSQAVDAALSELDEHLRANGPVADGTDQATDSAADTGPHTFPDGTAEVTDSVGDEGPHTFPDGTGSEPDATYGA